jgi:hypothetical protein
LDLVVELELVVGFSLNALLLNDLSNLLVDSLDLKPNLLKLFFVILTQFLFRVELLGHRVKFHVNLSDGRLESVDFLRGALSLSVKFFSSRSKFIESLDIVKTSIQKVNLFD